MKIDLSMKVEIDADTISRVNQDGTVIVMAMNEDEFFYKIDGLAAEMWQHFPNKDKTLAQIIDELAIEYSVSKEQVTSDTEVFLTKALELKLIKLF